MFPTFTISGTGVIILSVFLSVPLFFPCANFSVIWRICHYVTKCSSHTPGLYKYDSPTSGTSLKPLSDNWQYAGTLSRTSLIFTDAYLGQVSNYFITHAINNSKGTCCVCNWHSINPYAPPSYVNKENRSAILANRDSRYLLADQWKCKL
jgi:hypothetical protein